MHGPTSEPSRPVFSIITVCRNAERSIAKTIESVLNQAGLAGTTEHIVIDGVSTDGTLLTLAKYRHLRVVSEPDAGIYDAMNKGVSLARGDYIGILNANDWYEPDALAVVARAFGERPDVALVHGDIRRWNGDAPVDVVKPSRDQGVHGTRVMPVHHPACFVKKELFGRFGGFDITYPLCADYDWLRRVVNAGVVLRYRPRVLTNFRTGGVSTIRFAIRERYQVLRANGAGVLPAAATVGHVCAVALRNRIRRMEL